MSDFILDALQYYGAAAAVVAATIVALNLGRLWTGAAMVIFVSSAIALILWGFIQPESKGIGWQNVALLIINSVGVYRYFFSKHKPKNAQKTGTAHA